MTRSEPFEGILGQTGALDLLRRMLAGGRIPHALLLQGPEGVGKATTARRFVAALFCERGGCGACAVCRRVEHGAHPDLVQISLLPRERTDELASVISVRQIRELARLAGLAPREAGRRVFLIDPADRMNVEAQNALLKTLEEPAARALLLLVAARGHLLLPTVRSRCFALPFAPLHADALAAELRRRGLPADEAAGRAALAGGRPGVALALDPAALRERREALLEALEELATGSATRLVARAADLAGRDEATLVAGLELLCGLVRDAARAALRPDDEALLHVDLRERLARLGRRLGAGRSAAIVAAIDRTRGYLRFHTNRTLIAESLLAAAAGGPLPG